MNCTHKPANYKKLLTDGDAGMVCRHCQKPIRTKDPKKGNLIRKLLTIIPIVLFCALAYSGILSSKVALLACFFVTLGISIFGWLFVCRFVLEYEEVPEAKAGDAPTVDK